MLSYFEIVYPKTTPPGWVRGYKINTFSRQFMRFPELSKCWHLKLPPTHPPVGWGLKNVIDFSGQFMKFPGPLNPPNSPWAGSIFFSCEWLSYIYPNMCAKFGCGPTVVSKNRGVQIHLDRQTDKGKGTLQLYIVDTHPPPLLIMLYTFVTLFSGKADTLPPPLRYVTLEWPLKNGARHRGTELPLFV